MALVQPWRPLLLVLNVTAMITDSRLHTKPGLLLYYARGIKSIWKDSFVGAWDLCSFYLKFTRDRNLVFLEFVEEDLQNWQHALHRHQG